MRRFKQLYQLLIIALLLCPGFARAEDIKVKVCPPGGTHYQSFSSKPAKSGVPRYYWVEASAYCMRQSLTSRGTRVAHGTIAVDPKLIPYYSKIFVPGYGWGRALDCGSHIKGHKIDIWFPTSSECLHWGRRMVKIEVYPSK